MHHSVEDEPTTEQLRRVDRWATVSLAAMVVLTLLAGLLLSCSTARSEPLTPFFPHKPKGEMPPLYEQTAQAGTAVLKADRFDVAYVQPKNPAHRHIHDSLKQERILEKVQALLAPVKLPARITLSLEGCDGVVNATFWDDTIKVCYEYIEHALKYAPAAASQGLSSRDALIGPTIEVFLHEAGHAVLEVLDIPFFGREEEVADYFATYILLQLCKEDARRLILGASFVSGREAIDEQGKAPELRLLADTHSLPAQRYFNRWCMAYGANPVLFADAVGTGFLPHSRAKHCRYEYQTNEFAFKTLISPYMDEDLQRNVLTRNWFGSPDIEPQACSEPRHTPMADRSPPETAPAFHPE